VSDLVKEGLLDIDVIFLVEGEEESGSIGFANAAMQHKVKYHNEVTFDYTWY
jgi:di- and tripeptidase